MRDDDDDVGWAILALLPSGLLPATPGSGQTQDGKDVENAGHHRAVLSGS